MDSFSFYGVRVIRSKTLPPSLDFAVQTVFSDWYCEIGKTVDIPVKIMLYVKNISRRNIADVQIRLLGMREDYHQRILKIRTTYSMKVEKDKYLSLIHI